MLNNGWSEAQVAGFLGHQGAALVSQFYGHLLAYTPKIESVGFAKPSPGPSGTKVIDFPRRSG